MGEEAAAQFRNDPDVKQILKEGKSFSAKRSRIIKELGEDGECHWNVAELYFGGKIDSIVVGYAKNYQGWHQHTWGLKSEKVVETTWSNIGNEAYFGVTLSKSQAKSFVKLTDKYGPGQGGVRTRKGGSVLRVKEQESMEPFKQQDGDRLQSPRVEHVEDHQGHPRRSGKSLSPRGFGNNKKEEI